MKKILFTVGAVLLVTSGFVSESFGRASSGGSTTPGTPTTSTSGGEKVSGTAKETAQKASELQKLSTLQTMWRSIQSNSPGFCQAGRLKTEDDMASCATKKDEPSSFLKLYATFGAKKGSQMCALIANIGPNYYSSTTGSMKKLFGKGDANAQANSKYEIIVGKCYEAHKQ